MNPPEFLHNKLGLEPRTFIVDLGLVHHETMPPYLPLVQEGHARLLGIDASEETCRTLQHRASPWESYMEAYVGDGTKRILHKGRLPHPIHLGKNDGQPMDVRASASLFRPDPALFASFSGLDSLQQGSSKEIETITLDHIPETSGVHLLRLNLRGAELLVLKHAINRVIHALAIDVQVAFLPLYPDQPLFWAVDQFLLARGYILHKFITLVYPKFSQIIPSGSGSEFSTIPSNIDEATGEPTGGDQLVWGHALYVKDFRHGSALTKDQHRRLAAIVQDCYGSKDLARHLLERAELLAT